jgi:hypothetical protein
VEAHQVAREYTLEQLRAAREDFVDLARRKGDVQEEAYRRKKGKEWRGISRFLIK